MYILHNIDSFGLEETLNFSTFMEMIEWLTPCDDYEPGETVFIYGWDDPQDKNGTNYQLIVCDDLRYIARVAYKADPYSGEMPNDYFLQEFTSFEEAYKVALNMQELKQACYE